MPRDPFARLTQPAPPSAPQTWGEAPTPLDTIPVARPRSRRREWEKTNRGKTYRVPAPLVERAKAARQAIAGLAQKHMATADQVADVLLGWACIQAQAGRLTIEAAPTKRRKMTVRLVESGAGWPQPVDEPVKRKKARDMRLTYRLSPETRKALEGLSGEDIAAGEVVVAMLEYALTAVREGRVRLLAEPEIVRQKVGVWGR